VISAELHNRNPNIPEEGVRSIFNTVRSSFHRAGVEHEYFLFFVISQIIEAKKLSISRGAYLIEIAQGKIPQHSRLVQFFRRWRQIARYKMAKDSQED
jgi:hypothetical protein